MCIHAIFYDDRNFPEQVDILDPNDPNDPNYRYPRFDVYYAYSVNGGETFQWDDRRLFSTYEADPNDPAVNFLDDVHKRFELTDYIGITYRQSGIHTDVFTSFTGSHVTQDPEDDESLIWSSRIAWTQLP